MLSKYLNYDLMTAKFYVGNNLTNLELVSLRSSAGCLSEAVAVTLDLIVKQKRNISYQATMYICRKLYFNVEYYKLFYKQYKYKQCKVT